MSKNRKLPLGVIVLITFTIAIGFILLIGYFFSKIPSAEERCKQECAVSGKFGRLTHKYPLYVSQGKVPLVCECSR
jgi:hypothetical protein